MKRRLFGMGTATKKSREEGRRLFDEAFGPEQREKDAKQMILRKLPRGRQPGQKVTYNPFETLPVEDVIKHGTEDE